MGAGFWGVSINVDARQTDAVDNDRSTADTIQQMVAITRYSSTTPAIAGVVDSLLRSLPPHPSQTDVARSVWWFVKGRVKFREDEQTLGEQLGYGDVNQELLITPEVLLAMPQALGDCDDYSMLVASLTVAVGLPTWFVTIAADEEQPDRFSHVYVMVVVDGQEMYLDASHGGYPGWETNREKFRKVIWYVN